MKVPEPLVEAEVLAILEDVLGILREWHQREPPFVHGDVSLDNLVQNPDGTYELVGSGSRELPSNDAGPSRDLYGLGFLAIGLITGLDPQGLVTEDRKAWRQVANTSPRFAALIDALIEPDPAQRPSSARRIADEVRSLRRDSADSVAFRPIALGRTPAGLEYKAPPPVEVMATAEHLREPEPKRERRPVPHLLVLLIAILFGFMLLFAAGGCVKAIPPAMAPDSVVTYQTADGWSAEIRHFPGDGPPVLMVHGMGANHYNWDYHPDVSLAHHLQQQGWDVWVPELRGDPGSIPPHKKARGLIAFDDYALGDLPPIVDAVLEATDSERLFYVGHSMGGMLLYTSLAQFPEKIIAGVAISSPSSFQHPLKAYKLGKAFGWTMGGNGRVRFKSVAKLAAPFGKSNLIVGRLANRKNLDWGMVKGMARYALTDLPKPLVRQALTWVKSGELINLHGEPWVKPTDTPLMVLCGIKDKVVSEPDVASTCDRFEDCSYTELSVANGFSFDYGHIDPVVGASSKSEIYPLVSAFLEAHRDD